MEKPGWYFIKNSEGKYDGLWSLAVFSFAFIMFISLATLATWITLWGVYYFNTTTLDAKIVRGMKPPGFKFSEIASWVGTFGGLVLGPVVAGYVARRNQMFNPAPEEPLSFVVPEKLVAFEDDGH